MSPSQVFRSATLLLAGMLPYATHAATLYGVTATDLVSINTSTGVSTLIGSLGLAPNQTPGPLAWHPGEARLYGLVYDYSLDGGGLPVVSEQRFVRIDPFTGAVTHLTTFGNPASNPTYDAIEFLDHLGSLVVSQSQGGGLTSSAILASVTTSGVTTPLVTTGIDNDLLAYDGADSRLYSIDPNGLQEVRTVNVTTGSHSPLAGGLPSVTTGELAFDIDSDRLYALDYTILPAPNKSLYAIDTANGAGPISSSSITLSGDQVRGIAFAAVPEPHHAAAAAAATLVTWTVLTRRRSRSVRRS